MNNFIRPGVRRGFSIVASHACTAVLKAAKCSYSKIVGSLPFTVNT